MGNVDDGIVRTDIRDEFKLCNVYAKPKCSECFARYYCSGGCAANAFQFHGKITDAYDIGCEMQRKRVECAIMMKAAEAAEEETRNEEKETEKYCTFSCEYHCHDSACTGTCLRR